MRQIHSFSGPAMNQVIRFFCLLILAVIAWVAIADDAHARAGGGGGFSSGGGGGSSSSSSGGGGGGSSRSRSNRSGRSSGSDIPLTPQERLLLIAIIAVVVLIMIIKAVLEFHRRVHVPQVISRAHDISENLDEQHAIQTLSLADFDFSPPRFFGRVTTAFLRLQEGWSNQDIPAIRPFVSDGIVERFTLQFQEQKDQGIRNHMSSVTVASCRLVHASASPVFLTATVAITASAIDCDIDASGHTVRGNPRKHESFTEFWTFIRRPSLQQQKSHLGLIEGYCPNCASPIDDQGAQSLKCSSCGSLLTAGSHDWVLAEISQTTTKSTTADSASSQNPSISQYQQNNDPGFSCAHIEDRASVIFWRWAKSQRLANVQPLNKIADQSFAQQIAMNFPNLEDPQNNLRRYIGNIAVGGVQSLGVVPGPDFDRAVVKVEWSGATLAVPLSSRSHGKPQSVDGEGVYCVSVLTLTRKRGITTNPAFGLSSAHCPGCGGPESDPAHDACQFCGRVLNDGSGDWLLTAMDPEESPASNDAFDQLLREGYLPDPHAADRWSLTTLGPAIWVARVILADDVITAREQVIFTRFCTRHRLLPDQITAIVDTARREKLHGVTPKDRPDPDQAKRWVARLAATIFETGYFGSDDRQILRLTALRLGLTDSHAKQIEALVRADALTGARALIKNQKRP
jgi:hypothetical protein